jgi:S-adenosylmethionine synthetase
MRPTVERRTRISLDRLRPQPAGFPGRLAQEFLPLPNDTSLGVGTCPGIEIKRTTDMALQSTRVRPGMPMVERLFGLLGVHHKDQAEVRAAAAAILRGLELEESGASAGSA